MGSWGLLASRLDQSRFLHLAAAALVVNLVTPSYIYRGAGTTTVIDGYDSSLLTLGVAGITEHSGLGRAFG